MANMPVICMLLSNYLIVNVSNLNCPCRLIFIYLLLFIIIVGKK